MDEPDCCVWKVNWERTHITEKKPLEIDQVTRAGEGQLAGKEHTDTSGRQKFVLKADGGKGSYFSSNYLLQLRGRRLDILMIIWAVISGHDDALRTMTTQTITTVMRVLPAQKVPSLQQTCKMLILAFLKQVIQHLETLVWTVTLARRAACRNCFFKGRGSSSWYCQVQNPPWNL